MSDRLTLVMETCKLLHEISKLWSVRLNLVERAIASDPHSTPLDRQIKCYSGEELERWAMQRLSVEKGWLLDKGDPIRTRTVEFTTDDVEATCLIEGGRWLLTVLKGGKVMATDLDHPDCPQQLLFEPREELDIWPTVDMVFSMVKHEATMTFDLALLHGRPGSCSVFRSITLYPSH